MCGMCAMVGVVCSAQSGYLSVCLKFTCVPQCAAANLGVSHLSRAVGVEEGLIRRPVSSPYS